MRHYSDGHYLRSALWQTVKCDSHAVLVDWGGQHFSSKQSELAFAQPSRQHTNQQQEKREPEMPTKKTKQSILPLAVFCKEPSKKTYSKHKKLREKLEKKGTMSVTGKPPAWRVKKEKEEKGSRRRGGRKQRSGRSG